MVCASRPAARSSADGLVRRRQHDDVAAGVELGARGGVQRGGLAEPGRRRPTPGPTPPSPHSTRTASAWSAPNGLGSAAIACSTSVSSIGTRRCRDQLRATSARTSVLDGAVLDGGPLGRAAPLGVGHQPHDQR